MPGMADGADAVPETGEKVAEAAAAVMDGVEGVGKANWPAFPATRGIDLGDQAGSARLSSITTTRRPPSTPTGSTVAGSRSAGSTTRSATPAELPCPASSSSSTTRGGTGSAAAFWTGSAKICRAIAGRSPRRRPRPAVLGRDPRGPSW